MAALTAMFVAASVLQGVNAINQANAAKRAGKDAQRLNNQNADLATMQAADALARGEEDVSRLRTDTSQTVGSQRAAMAAQGVEIDRDTAAQVVSDTEMIGAKDVLTARNNARRQAWGFQVEAQNYREAGKAAKRAGDRAYGQTLLTGATQLAGNLYGSGLFAKGGASSFNGPRGYLSGKRGSMG